MLNIIPGAGRAGCMEDKLAHSVTALQNIGYWASHSLSHFRLGMSRSYFTHLFKGRKGEFERTMGATLPLKQTSNRLLLSAYCTRHVGWTS